MALEAKTSTIITAGCGEAPVVPCYRPAEAAAGHPPAALARPDSLTLAAFGAFIVIAGSASVAIRYTYQEISPYWGGFLRFGLAALIFWLLVWARRIPLPRGRSLAASALFGTLSVGLAFMFFYWGLVKTPASVASTITSMVPLLTLFFASAHGLESIRMRSLLGGLFAVGGITVIMGSSLARGGEASIPHLIAILLGAACIAEAGVIAKRIPRSHPIATNAIAMTIGSLIMLGATMFLGESRAFPTSAGIWAALIYLGTIGSVATFMLYLFVLGRWTASGASYGFVLSPIVTVILAASLAGEAISGFFLIGALLVLFGVWVGAMSGSGKG